MTPDEPTEVAADPTLRISPDTSPDLTGTERDVELEDDTELDEDIDPSKLPLVARRALTTLLSSRFITRSRNRLVWDAILAYEDELRERLSDLFLNLVIDREYEVAFKRQDPREDAPKLLRRDKPLSRDATLLLLNLRKEHMYSDAVDGTVVIARTQAAEFLRPFREDGDADEARFDRRVDTAVRVLIDLRLLTPDADVDYLYLVSPAVVPLVGVEEVLRLEQYFRGAAAEAEAADVTPDIAEPEPTTPAEPDPVEVEVEEEQAIPTQESTPVPAVEDEPMLLTLDVAEEKA